MGGASIFRLRKGDPNVSVIIETLTNHGASQIMAQKFIPEIAQGDIVEPRYQQEVDDDAPEPQRHDVGSNPRSKGDEQSGRDFDHANREHECIPRHW